MTQGYLSHMISGVFDTCEFSNYFADFFAHYLAKFFKLFGNRGGVQKLKLLDRGEIKAAEAHRLAKMRLPHKRVFGHFGEAVLAQLPNKEQNIAKQLAKSHPNHAVCTDWRQIYMGDYKTYICLLYKGFRRLHFA